MDRRFNTENFEKSLKAHTDDFKMVPSKKVWRGIYNDLHPGTRWPSVAMSLVFIFTLVVIGHLNTNNGKLLASLNTTDKTLAAVKKSGSKKSKIHLIQPVSSNSQAGTLANNSPASKEVATGDLNASPAIHQIADRNSPNSNVSSDGDMVKNYNSGDDVVTASLQPAKKTGSRTVTTNGDANITVNDNTSFTNSAENTTIPEKNLPLNINTVITNKKENITASNKSPEVKQPVKNPAKEVTSKQEEKTTHTHLLSKKVRDKISVTYYVSPSISYRSLSEKSFASVPNQNAPAGASVSSVNNSVINKAIIGFETGVSLDYKLSKRLQFKTGLQLNYAGYNIKANYVHPVSATLLLTNDFTGNPYAYNSTSNYGNGSGSTYVTLHQYSFQVSAPVGFKYRIAGSSKVQVNAEATFQPSYIIASKAYMLSGDKRNYVTEPSLIRNLNMSTNFGTFVSFKSNNFNWQIGPQVFYQLLSTYSSNYPISEHLVNYGIRFGVSKLKK